MINTFPLIFGREGGAETSALGLLGMPQGHEECKSIAALYSKSDVLKQKIVDILFDLISAQSNKNDRNTLISLKRDVFNNRSIEKYSDIILNYDNLKTAIDSYVSCSFQLSIKNEQFKINFEEYLIKGIDTINASWKEHFLANGILFSSGVLFDEITKIWPIDFKDWTKHKNLLNTILKYFIRSVTKTTPFSSLNRVFVMELKESRYKNINFNQRESRIQISNLIFFRVKEILLGNINFLRQLTLYPNPAIYKGPKDDDHIIFFININNNEYFKKAKKNAVVLDLIEYANQSVRYREIEDLIAIKYSQDEETATEFLNALIKEGILIPQFPVGIDNTYWVSALIDLIDNKALNSDPEVLKVRSFLEILKSTVYSLEATLDISKRNQYTDDCIQLLDNKLNFDKTSKYLNELVISKSLFYENVFTTPTVEFETRYIEAVQDSIRKVFFAINNISVKNRGIDFLYKYIKEIGGKKMPLLQAYDEIYLRNKKVLDSESCNADNIVLNKLLAELGKSDINYAIDISSLIDSESVKIKNDVKFGAFVQFVDSDSGEVIINSFSGGFGSNVSRFLGFCPPDVLDRFREYIESCERGFIVADVRDASIHNSSSFPILANNIIDVASGYTDSGKTIPLNSLFLSICNDDKVQIITEEGDIVKPVNFSMEAITRKSKFTQFLELFNNTDLFGYKYLMQRVTDFLTDSALNCNVYASPRILFNKEVILKRKQWHINVNYLRSYIGASEERPEIFCLKINLFLRDYSIPSEVFVKFSRSGRSNESQSIDGYKPYYINFMAPLSVLLFMNMLSKSDKVIELSEVLPAFPNATESSSGRVKEYVMNF